MFEFGTGKTMKRLNQMLDDAINGTFQESAFNETELSRLESRWKQYLSLSGKSVAQAEKERENLKKLVSDISHQTRTPLSSILLYAELMEDAAETESTKELARQILSQTKKLEFLIQALVKMSRLETDILKVVPRQQPVRLLVEQTIETIIPKAEAKHIQIVCAQLSDTEAVYDLKWTAEALANILDNAIKYSPVSSTVLVEMKKFQLYTCISVKDQGMGIRESEKAQIFGRFYRSMDVQQEDGIGIGLYLAREILQRENGYIKVHSRKGEGTCFSLYLPAGADKSIL
ncbi:MAG: HAMP domain-containing histidine kinase [Lachnospiraceae bacterium]|nr:HAMP domain-containing histidine kinase [Lachnospiraceae bacterium]MCI9100498.1 HAMP domain-containing histidine kinase [Lachnospiraceae bacterium]MCI9358433.1 HAMP domain-containing histidine kinase [Lachnospiraceae bacterium]